MKIALDLPERAFTVLALVSFSGAVLPLLRFGAVEGVDAMEGDPVLRVVWAVLYVTTFVLVLLRFSTIARVIPSTPTLWVLIFLALASAGWASYPTVSLRKSIALLGTTLFGLYFGARFTAAQQVRLLALAFGLIIVTSFVMALAFPAYGINHTYHEGAWQGAFIHKNGLGRAMVVALTLFLVLGGSLPRRRRWVAITGVTCAVLLIVLSESRTAMVLSLCLVVIYWLLRQLRRLDPALALAVASLVVVIGGGAMFSLAVNAEAATSALGRDVTLTGRTVLWAVVLEFIGQRPWLGHGYGSFWLGATGPSGTIWRIVRWDVPHAHNGVLDLALELGVVGVALFLWAYGSTVVRSYRLFASSFQPTDAWPLVVVLITTLYNVTESTLLSRNSIYWVLFVSAVCTTYRAVQRPGPAGAARGARHNHVAAAPLPPARSRRTNHPADAGGRR